MKRFLKRYVTFIHTIDVRILYENKHIACFNKKGENEQSYKEKIYISIKRCELNGFGVKVM